MTTTRISRFYGTIELDEMEAALLPHIVHLHGISLSAIPYRFLPISDPGNRFDHSLGTLFHAQHAVMEKNEFNGYEREIRAAALLHDRKHPPFSHLADPISIMVTGHAHEERLLDWLQGSAISKTLRRFGMDPETIGKLVSGDLPPYSDVISGSMDVDNLSNVIEYGISTGILWGSGWSQLDQFYRISQSMRIYEGNLVMIEEPSYPPRVKQLVHLWLDARRAVYRFIYSPTNLASGSMLFRAIDLAFHEEKIKPTFFDLTDDEALSFLHRCGGETTKLLKDLERQPYLLLYESKTTEPSADFERKAKRSPDSFMYRHALSSTLAKHLKSKDHTVCAYLGMDRGVRHITIPYSSFADFHNQLNNWEILGATLAPEWIVQIYAHPSLRDRKQEIHEFMKGAFS